MHHCKQTPGGGQSARLSINIVGVRDHVLIARTGCLAAANWLRQVTTNPANLQLYRQAHRSYLFKRNVQFGTDFSVRVDVSAAY
jgi:hypothetical protein